MKLPVRLLIVAGMFAVVALTVRGQVTSPQPAAKPAVQKGSTAPDNAHLRTLLTEKRDALRQIEDARRSEHQQGVGGPEDLINASLAVIDADLDLARTAKERITLCEKRVQLRKQLEEAVQAQQKAAGVPFEELQRVRVNRLDAEIALEREREAVSATR